MKGIICGECMKEIEEERIIFEEGRLIKYPAYCIKCQVKFMRGPWKRG